METLTSPHLARPATQEPRALVIHAHGDWLKSVQDGKFDFFKKLVRTATARGTTSRIVAADGAASRLLLGQDHMHILVGCPPSYGRGQLHALPGHVWGFWYLDEVGTFQHSSLRFARFCADTVDADRAAYFFNGVTSYMLRENVSNRPQEPRLDKPLDPAAATIFCQQNELGPERSHYLTTEQMIRVTARTCAEERVYVKPYPDQTKLARKALIDLVADYPNVVVTDASIHDLTAASHMVVTQNSSAGFEALMQRRCVITCGKSDYWHATLTPKKENDLRDALLYGPEEMAEFPYDKYLYWFLDRNCLEPAKEEFTRRAWARIRDKACI